MRYVFPNVGRCGLGNMLVPWACAEVYARDNHCRILKPGFERVPRLGPILRGEKYKRLYLGNFDFSKSAYICGIQRLLVRLFDWSETKEFSGFPADWERIIACNCDYIRQRLWTITSGDIRRRVEGFDQEPYIGVHVRRGDFKQAGVLTDDDWFVRAIEKGKVIDGGNRIKVFSDAFPEQLEFIGRAFPDDDVRIMPKAKPLEDIWALSNARTLVGSSRSSFSIWAVLLGQMPSLWSPVNAPGNLYAGDDRKILVE